jgi:hypothetical protein
VTRPGGRGSHRWGPIIAAIVFVVCGVPAAGCAGLLYRLGAFGPDVQAMLDELQITAPGIRYMTPDGLTVLPDWRHGRREIIASVPAAEFQAIIEREFEAKGWKQGRCYFEYEYVTEPCWRHGSVAAGLSLSAYETYSEAIIDAEAQ